METKTNVGDMKELFKNRIGLNMIGLKSISRFKIDIDIYKRC